MRYRLKKLLEISRRTGIDTRPAVQSYETADDLGCQVKPPTIQALDSFFREHGAALAVQACRKALLEWGGHPSEITHTVAVTCTNQGSPGYDLGVNHELGLAPDVERTLLHGVGCAGGLAIMRTAAQIATSAAARGEPARVLAFACELCTPNARHDLAEAEACTAPERLNIAPALFSDGAAAFVLCNDAGLGRAAGAPAAEPLFELVEWGNATTAGTAERMGIFTEADGFRTVLSREVPAQTRKAIAPLFGRLAPAYRRKARDATLGARDFDWALHPGGQAIIVGAQEELGLEDHHLRATRQIYRTKGNSSSPSVLAVLDLLRRLGRGRDHVVATSFGPGLVCEMALLRRCRPVDEFQGKAGDWAE